MKRRLSIAIKGSARIKQRTTVIKYAVAGSLIFTLFGISAFLYFNIADSEQAQAKRNPVVSESTYSKANLVDLSHLTNEEIQLLRDHEFSRDTVQKEYASVKWNINSSLSHLTLEVNNNKYEYSLDLFDMNGLRVIHFSNLTDNKVFVDKLKLFPNQEYAYLVKNSIGEIYAGNMMF